jgi:DNA-binding CsgD family transcriptional regulator
VRDGQQTPPDLFVGRTAERERIAQAVRRAQAGEPWLVAIEGDPGMGKTTLARQALDGLRVLSARAGQGEADLEYGVVEQLLRSAGEAGRAAVDPAESSFRVGARLLQVVDGLQAAGPLALLIDDLQWADRQSAEALTFTLRRLSVDQVVAVVTYRGPGRSLDPAGQRLLTSVEHRLHLPLGGLSEDEVAELAARLAPGTLDEQATERLYLGTGGHPLYVHTVLADGSGFDPRSRQLALPRSLADAVSEQLRGFPPAARDILEMLAVLNLRVPLAQLGQAAEVGSPSEAIEPAVAAGLVDWWPDEPSAPVQLRHLLVRDAIYAGITPTRRRWLHGRAAGLVSRPESWPHRVAALDQPDESLAAELEQLAAGEADRGRLELAARHLQWASDVSPARADRERRLLTAALHLTLADEARGAALRPAVLATAPSALRGCVLGTMALSAGQLTEAQALLTQALEQARSDPGHQPLAAMIAGRLALSHTLLGHGEQAISLGRQALATGQLPAAAAARTRTLVAAGVALAQGPRQAQGELGFLAADPARVTGLDLDALTFRGVLALVTGDLGRAVADIGASVGMINRGVPPALGLQAYFLLSLAQYLAGQWDDVLLTAEQGLSAASVSSRRFELPLLHLAAACVPAGRGAAGEAERHAELAAEAAASVDYGQELVYAGMARAFVCQGTGDYLGMADALAAWRDDATLDERSRFYAGLWRPLLAEGLIGSGQQDAATEVLDQLEAATGAGEHGYLRPVLAWLRGWQAEQQDRPADALRIYAAADASLDGQSPVYAGRLLLAHGRLLRRTSRRAEAIEQLRRARVRFAALRAAPFAERADQELAACRLPRDPEAEKKSYLELTSRETEIAHLVGRGLSNPEIAAELFISRKAVEYHLSNIYGKYGIHSRQQLRRLVEQWREPAAI